MLRWLDKSWFLLALMLVLTLAGVFGHFGRSEHVDIFLRIVQPSITTGIVLFLMAFSLDASKRTAALRQPGAAVWGSVVNLGIVPIAAWPLAWMQQLPDFEIGLFITAIVPCTLATASVFTRRAGGNDAVSLLVTLATNLACVIVTPLWLAVHGSGVGHFDTGKLILQMTYTVLLPVIIGQLAQRPAVMSAFVTSHRSRIGLAAQLMILLLIAIAAMNAGRTLAEHAVWPSVWAGCILTLSCLCLHLLAMGLGWLGSRLAGWHRGEAIAVAISGSQKTLPVGLMLIARPEWTGGTTPFIVFPLIAYHAVQLIVDSVLVERWRTPQPPSAAS